MQRALSTGGCWLACALLLGACGGEASFGGGENVSPTPTLPPDGETPMALRLGTLDQGVFSEGALSIGVTELSAGGQTAVRVDVVDAAGERVSDAPLSVSFQSDCSAAGLSRFEPVVVDASSGRFDTTYIAQGCAGADEITARVTLDDGTETARGTVNVAAAELGRVEFVFVDPAIIGLIGSPIPTQATVQFRVRDTTGGVVPNQRVEFALSTTVGQVSLTPSSAVSDNQGIVRTVVSAGSIPTAVRVRASVAVDGGAIIATQSEQLAISTGLPDQDSMTLAFDRLAVDGTCIGEPVNVSVRMADRFNNPVPEGTAVNFRTEGGAIQSTCFTGDPLGDPTLESGVCSVVLNVRNPRPDNGRVAVLATALGEETFIDRNGNGFFDAGDGFDDDLPEAFVDSDGDGNRGPDEPFVDTNQDQQYSLGDGEFNGYVCDAPGLNCESDLVHVRASGDVIFSLARNGLLINCSDAGGLCPFQPAGVGPGETLGINIEVSDINGQVPPSGTTYTLITTDGSVLEPATVGPFNTNTGPQQVSFVHQTPDEAPDPNRDIILTLQVEIPPSECSGATTFSQIVGIYRL